jgi:hypothetical protein
MMAWTQRDIARLEKKTDDASRRMYEVKTDLKEDEVKVDPILSKAELRPA